MSFEREYIVGELVENVSAAHDEDVGSEEDIHQRYVFQAARAMLHRERGKVIEQEKTYLKTKSQDGFMDQFASEIEIQLDKLRRDTPMK